LSGSPQTATLLGKIILADMSARFASPDANFASVNPAEADLAAFTAWTTDPCVHKEMLLALADLDKFKTPLILYVAGVSIADSEPSKAVMLLIDASAIQYRQKSTLLDIEPNRIAEQAARLAYDHFANKELDCRLALDAFDNCSRIASDKMTEQIQYLYGKLLFDCDKIQQSFEVLGRLDERSNTIWRDKANFELLKMKINSEPEETLVQLRNFILNCTGRDEQKKQLRSEAMDIYCQELLNRDNKDSATLVLSLLDAAEETPGLRYDLFRAQALLQSGRLEESAHFMSKAVIIDSGSMAPSAAQITSEIVNKIELWQQDANDFNQMLLDCNTLADFANKSLNSRQTALILAELSILQGKRFLTPFSQTDENDITWLRVQARLLMQEGSFEKSAKLWAKIAESRRYETTGSNQKSYGWWQAKFYELYCLANIPQPDKQNIRHAIEVLQNSYTDIPRPWAEKLNGLKESCGN
jgi:tetratricopeptide (TPR) repeat protein